MSAADLDLEDPLHFTQCDICLMSFVGREDGETCGDPDYTATLADVTARAKAMNLSIRQIREHLKAQGIPVVDKWRNDADRCQGILRPMGNDITRARLLALVSVDVRPLVDEICAVLNRCAAQEKS